MEWIKDYWYVILLGLIAAMFLFGRKTNVNAHDHQNDSNAGGKEHKDGSGCCH